MGLKICLAGEGAMGQTHIKTLKQIDGVEVVSLAGGIEADAAEFAKAWEIPHYALELEECLSRPGVEAVILATPNQIHAAQIELALSMGKHVLVEIPMGIDLEQCRRIAAAEESSGLVCMVAHTQRYQPAMRELCRRVHDGSLTPHHLVVQTYFLRRENINAFGNPRTWTDDLLWHQACHAIDFIYWLFGEVEMEIWGQTGPLHRDLEIPMDMTIGMRSRAGCLVSAALSFNNHGPIQANYRLIGEENTYLLAGGRLSDWEGNEIPTTGEGAHLRQDREFFEAISNGRAPLTNCRACLPVMELIDRIQQSMDED